MNRTNTKQTARNETIAGMAARARLHDMGGGSRIHRVLPLRFRIAQKFWNENKDEHADIMRTMTLAEARDAGLL